LNTRLLRLCALAVLALLTACASQRPRVASEIAESGLAARESVLFEQPKFSLQGRIGVSNGKDAGSGQFVWTQDGTAFDFTLTVTLTGDRFRLFGRPGRVTLVDAEGRSQNGFDAEALLAERTGWHIPVQQLGYWVRAMRAPGEEAVPQFGDDGLLTSLAQSRWQIDYRGWTRDRSTALPLKLTATRKPHRVRVVIRDWS
jgi:outer membrane lipoprotein LolB